MSNTVHNSCLLNAVESGLNFLLIIKGLLIDKGIELYGDKLVNAETKSQVLEFVMGRFRAFYQEQGVSVDVIQAVLAKAPLGIYIG